MTPCAFPESQLQSQFTYISPLRLFVCISYHEKFLIPWIKIIEVATSIDNSITKLNKLLRIELIVFGVIGGLTALGFMYFESTIFKGVCLSIFPLMFYGMVREYSFHKSLQSELEANSVSVILSNKEEYVRKVDYFNIMTAFFVIGMVLALWGAASKFQLTCGAGIGIVLFAGMLMVAHVITNYLLEILYHEIGREERP